MSTNCQAEMIVSFVVGGNTIPHPFGLDVFGNNIYWTDWENRNIERANKINGQNRTVLSSNMNDLMDVRVFHRNRKPIKHSCLGKNGGCSHLCLLRPKGHSCACPTGIKLGVSGARNFCKYVHETVTTSKSSHFESN